VGRKAPPGRPCRSILGCDGVERLGQAAQARAGGGEASYPAHRIGHGPTEAVEPWGDYDVTGAQAREQPAQYCLPATVLRTGLLLHNLFAACLDQRPALCASIGVVTAASPEIADQHGTALPDAAGFEPPLPLR